MPQRAGRRMAPLAGGRRAGTDGRGRKRRGPGSRTGAVDRPGHRVGQRRCQQSGHAPGPAAGRHRFGEHLQRAAPRYRRRGPVAAATHGHAARQQRAGLARGQLRPAPLQQPARQGGRRADPAHRPAMAPVPQRRDHRLGRLAAAGGAAGHPGLLPVARHHPAARAAHRPHDRTLHAAGAHRPLDHGDLVRGAGGVGHHHAAGQAFPAAADGAHAVRLAHLHPEEPAQRGGADLHAVGDRRLRGVRAR
ncbi:hypothetical protein D9M72_435090 [compost metagenome]